MKTTTFAELNMSEPAPRQGGPPSESFRNPRGLYTIRRSLLLLLLTLPFALSVGSAQAQSCGEVPVETMCLSTNHSKAYFEEYTNATLPKIRKFLKQTISTETNRFYLLSTNYPAGYEDTSYGGTTATHGWEAGLYDETNNACYRATNVSVWNWRAEVLTNSYLGCSSNYSGWLDQRYQSNYSYNVYALSGTDKRYISNFFINLTEAALSNEGWSSTNALIDGAYYFLYADWSQFSQTILSNQWLNSGLEPPNMSYTTSTSPSSVLVAGGLVSLQPDRKVYEFDPQPANGFGQTVYTLTNEYTTLMLKTNTAGDLAALSFDDPNLACGAGGVAGGSLTADELDCVLSKMRFRFQYKLETNTTYEITRYFDVMVWTNASEPLSYTNVAFSQVAFTNLVAGDGKERWETNEIAPALGANGELGFYLNSTNFLAGDQGTNTVEIRVSRVTVQPYDGGCASCAGHDGTIGAPGLAAGNGLQLRFSLGRTEKGIRVGDLRVHSDTITPALYTPAALGLMALGDKVTVVTNTDGSLRQVGSSQCLADIQALSNGRGYTAVFYPADAFLPNNGNNLISTGGLTADVTWTVENPDANATNRVRVVETHGSLSITNLLTWNPSSGGWERLTGNNLRKEVLTKSMDASQTTRTETRQTIDPPTSQVIAQTIEKYQLLGAGERLVEQIEGFDGICLTNSYGYDSNGRLCGTTNSSGFWQAYEYDARGRTLTLSSPGNAYPGSIRTISYSYDDALESYGDHPELWASRARVTTEALNWSTVSKTFFLAAPDQTIEARAATDTANPFEPGNLCTTNHFYPDGHPSATLLKSIEHPDGAVTLYTYASGPNLMTNIVDSGQANSAHDAIVNGTRTITVLGTFNELLRREVYDLSPDHPGGLLTDRELYVYTDALHRSHWVTHLDGTSNLVQYACCGLDLTVDRDGAVTQYSYDALKRQTSVQQVTLGITTSNVLDTAGRQVATIRKGGTSTLTSWAGSYDPLGRLDRETNALGGVTIHTYAVDEFGFATNTTTYPDGGTRVETLYPDGSIAQVTGNAVFPVRYDYSAGIRAETKLNTNGTDTLEWTRQYADLLGRAVKTDRSYNTTTTYFSYNNQGHLWKETDPDGVVTLRQYNARGELECTALDMDRNDTVDFAGSDRITYTTRDVVTSHGTTVRRTRTYGWIASGGASNLLSMTETSVDGLQSWSTVFRDTSTPVTTHTVTVPGASRTVTVTAPDGSYTISLYSYGRLTSVTRYDSQNGQLGQTSYGYDALGRQNTVTDSRNGSTSYAYNNADQVTSVTTPAPGPGYSPQTTTTSYDTSSRAWRIVQPDGSSVTNAYYPTGLLKKTSGSRTYPVEYTYDFAGRMRTMTTWKNFANNTGAAVTSWTYNSLGLVETKDYPDALTGEATQPYGGNGLFYYYTSAGRLYLRIWVRNLTTYYTYDNGGSLATVTYSDGLTPNLEYGYDRLGRRGTTTQTLNSASSVVNLAYNDAGELLSESYSGGPLSGLTVTNTYDTNLRRTGLAIHQSNNPLIQQSFGWDTASRLSTVSDGTHSAAYNYLADSSLIGEIAFSNATTRVMTTTKSWDHLNRLKSISSAYSASSAVSFFYGYNSANQRTKNTHVDGSYWVYSYDSLGQVTSGKKYWSDDTPVAGQQFEYAFDDIGNRSSTKAGGDATGTPSSLREATYSANYLNQYTSRTVPGALDVLGVALATNAVSVNSATAYRKREYFWKEVSVANSNTQVWQSITVSSGGNNVTGNVLVAASPEQFTHDADGNLTSDSLWTSTWNGENRRITIESTAAVPTAAKAREEWTYLPDGRWIERIVSTNDGYAYFPAFTNRFVWDGNVLLAVLNHTNGLELAFMRGLDLSGTLQGAGGVGGLLAVQVGPAVPSGPLANTAHFVANDGNGNVAALVQASDSTLSAQYEYGPFTEPIRQTGPMAKINPIGFSTQYRDSVTGDWKYLYRDLNWGEGRWNSRDPIGEHGFGLLVASSKKRLIPGIILHGFVNNTPVDNYDYLGLTGTGVGGASCAISPYNSGRVSFRGFSSEQLAEFRLINEDQTAGGTPDGSGVSSGRVDGFWWKGIRTHWYKIPDFCWAIVEPEFSEDGFFVKWCCHDCSRLLCEMSTILKDRPCIPGFVPNSGNTRIGKYPFED